MSLRKIININEIEFIKNKILENKFCLTPLLADNDSIDMDELENMAFNFSANDINIISVFKDKRNYRRKDYLITLNINNLIYNKENWFTYDNYLHVFEDTEVYIDNYS
jgi:hypothetical protein